MRKILKILQKHIELIFFSTALIFLFINPLASSGYSLCILRNVGFDYCPGCGLGSSIHEALHFNFNNSFNLHPLGIFAVLVIILRIFQLIRYNFRERKYGHGISNDSRYGKR